MALVEIGAPGSAVVEAWYVSFSVSENTVIAQNIIHQLVAVRWLENIELNQPEIQSQSWIEPSEPSLCSFAQKRPGTLLQVGTCASDRLVQT